MHSKHQFALITHVLLAVHIGISNKLEANLNMKGVSFFLLTLYMYRVCKKTETFRN